MTFGIETQEECFKSPENLSMKKKSQFRILKVIAANIIVLLIIVISALFFLEQYTERIARSVLNNEFIKLELSRVYDVDFDKVSFQILSGRI